MAEAAAPVLAGRLEHVGPSGDDAVANGDAGKGRHGARLHRMAGRRPSRRGGGSPRPVGAGALVVEVGGQQVVAQVEARQVGVRGGQQLGQQVGGLTAHGTG